MDEVKSAPKNNGTVQRPSSEQLADLHVYLVPEQRWLKKRKLAKNHVTEYAVSAGFVRIVPQYRLVDVRREIERQLGYDVVPQSYVFLRSVGRNFTQVKASQEMDLKAKNFMPPHANEPEIYLKAGSYTDQYWSQGDESAVEEAHLDTRRTSDIIDKRVRALSPASSPDGFLPEVESTKFVLSKPSKVRRSSLSSAEQGQQKHSGSLHHHRVTTTTTTRKSTTTIEEHSSTKSVQLVRQTPSSCVSLREQSLVKATPVERTVSDKDIEEVDAAPRLAKDSGLPEDILSALQRSRDSEEGEYASGTRRGSLLGVGSTGPGYIIVPDGERRSPSPGPSHGKSYADKTAAPSEQRQRRLLPEDSSEPRVTASSRRRGSYASDIARREEASKDSQRAASRAKRRGSYVSASRGTPSHLNGTEREPDLAEEGQRSPSRTGSHHDDGSSAASSQLKAQEDRVGERTRKGSYTEEGVTTIQPGVSDDEGRSVYHRRRSIATTSPTRSEQSQARQEEDRPYSATGRAESAASETKDAVARPSGAENIASEKEVERKASVEKADVKDTVRDSEERDSAVVRRKNSSEDADGASGAGERSGPRKPSYEILAYERQRIERESESKRTIFQVAQREQESLASESKIGEAGVRTEEGSQAQEVRREVEERRDERGDPSTQQEEVGSEGPAVAVGRERKHRSKGEKATRRIERLTRNLEALRSERQVCEAKREDLLRRARFLQHKTTSTRDQARDMWRRRYLDEKKATPRLEEECGRWRLELEKLHRELLAKVDGELRFSGHRLEQPSDRLSYKIMIAKILQEIEDLKRRLEYTRIALGAEVRLRSHAEREVRTLREDLLKKKIQVTLTRKETRTVMAPFLRDSFYFAGAV